jgi:hypothetical protein
MNVTHTMYGLSPNETSKPRAGDICILLAPNYEQAAHMRQRLSTLQQEFKGFLNPTPYVQLQRFRIGKEALDALRPSVRTVAQQTPPLSIMAQSLEPFYSTMRAKELLKCRVDVSLVQELFVRLTGTLLDGKVTPLELELHPHVTMLEDVQMISLKAKPYAHLLFTAQRLVIVRLKGPGFYTALFSLPLSGCDPEEARVEQGHL